MEMSQQETVYISPIQGRFHIHGGESTMPKRCGTKPLTGIRGHSYLKFHNVSNFFIAGAPRVLFIDTHRELFAAIALLQENCRSSSIMDVLLTYLLIQMTLQQILDEGSQISSLDISLNCAWLLQSRALKDRLPVS
jgi:hypothetical protein